MSHAFPRRVVAVWDAEATAIAPAAPRSRPRRKPKEKVRKNADGPVGLPTRSPDGFLTGVKDFFVGLFTQWDQLAFVVMFAVIVKLAIDVLMSLY